MWCITLWNVWWKLTSNFTKQIPRNRMQQFVFRLHLQNPRWDCARIASASATFIVQNRCQSNKMRSFDRPSNHHAEARSPAHSSIHPRDAERPSQHLSNDRLDSKHWKNLFKSAPLKSMDARLEPGNALWRYGNVWEGNRVSRPAICSWFWTNSSSRWTFSNAFLVNKMLTQ